MICLWFDSYMFSLIKVMVVMVATTELDNTYRHVLTEQYNLAVKYFCLPNNYAYLFLKYTSMCRIACKEAP
jgi:hypothetical protein